MPQADENSRAWASKLKQCDFAGQIDLSEDDLRKIAPFIRQGFEHYAPSDHHHAARVVFAVNCAYYAQDEGFWDYCCRLLSEENTPQTQTRLGRKIEESLIRFNFIERHLYGPFRCVGPVLEQTGITRRSIPRFAKILQACRETAWSDVLTLDFRQFISVVETVQAGTYLGYFLKNNDKSGWEFTRSVARSLSQFESERISRDTLQTLQGYRPGFWKELNGHIQLDPGPTPDRSISLPRLVFDRAQAQVLIHFDHDLVERRAFVFADEIVENSNWPLTRLSDFKLSYKVEIRAEGRPTRGYAFRGWPIDSEPVAIFHPQRGYIPHDASLPSGILILLAPAGTQIPPSITLLTDFEFVNISDAKYQYWQIEVSPGADLSSLGYTRRDARANVISWAHNAVRLPGSIDPGDVFLGQLPRLKITNMGPFQEGRLALFLESDGKTRRIEVDAAHISIPVDPIFSGEINVEPLGRFREGDSTYAECRLQFTLLSEITCTWPTRLYSPIDCPVISFIAPPRVTAVFHECEKTAPGVWSAAPGSRFVEGVLHIPQKTISLAWPIYRAGFGREGCGLQRCFDVSEFDVDFQTHLSGLPSSKIRLKVGADKIVTVFDIPQSFDAAGHKRLSSFSFRDSFHKFTEPAGDIQIWGESDWISTGSSLLNFLLIQEWLFSAPSSESPTWFRSIDSTLCRWLAEVRNALAAKAPAPRFVSDVSLPPTTGFWADEIWAMLLVFNSTTPCDPVSSLATREASKIKPEVLKTLEWVYSARRMIEQGHADERCNLLIMDYQSLAWRPPRQEWIDRMADLCNQLQQLLDLDIMISEWAHEATAPMRAVLRSWIARQTGGRDVTEAYAYARQQQFKIAYSLAEFAEHDTNSGLIRDLAFLLKTLIRFKMNLPVNPPPAGMHRKLQPFILGISWLATPLNGHIIPPHGLNGIDPNILPLHSSEIAQLRRAIGLPPA